MLRKDFALQKRCYSSNFEERFHFSKYLASKKFRFGYGLVFLSFFLMICYILISFSQRRSHVDGKIAIQVACHLCKIFRGEIFFLSEGM